MIVVYATVILVFAITGMTMLLNLNPMGLGRKKCTLFFSLMILVVAISTVLVLEIGLAFAALYPLLIHLPLVIIFYVLSGRGMAKVFFALLTMVFLTYPPALFYRLAEKHLGANGPISTVVLVLSCLLVLLCIRKYMQPDTNYVMEHSTSREILYFCFVPIGYNILVYTLGRYDYNTTDHLTRVVLFLSALGVYSLLLGFFRHTREIESMQLERDVLALQIQAAGKQLLTLQASSEQATLYRHDMRHQLALLSGLLAEGDLQGATTYLRQAQDDIDSITPARYCGNNTINLILSHFVEQADRLGVTLLTEVMLPIEFVFSDTELCALLSNGLENAIDAAAEVGDVTLRSVLLTIKESQNRLLILVQNPYRGAVQTRDGIPASTQEGHGFGCRSMVAMAEKHGGFCTFKAEEGVFTLRLVLPLA